MMKNEGIRTHVYPSMSYEEVTDALHSWNIWVSQEQLSSPTPELVEGLYYACLMKAVDVTEEGLLEQLQDLLSKVDYPDLLSAAASHNILMYHLKRFAIAAKVEDFSTADLARPHPVRNLEILAAFINYIKFVEHKTDNFLVELRNRSSKLLAQKKQLVEDITKVESEVTTIKKEIQIAQPKCEQLSEENAQLKASLMAKRELQTQALQIADDLKRERRELLERMEAIHSQLAAVNDSIQRSRSRIVQSPERIKRTISTMGSTAAEEKKTVAMYEAKARDLQAKSNALLIIEKDVRGCVEQLIMVQKEDETLQNAYRRVGEVKDSFEAKQIERQELNSKAERAQKQLSNAHEKLERAKRNAEDRRVASQKTIDRLQQQYDDMLVERQDNDMEVEKLRQEAIEIETKMAENLKKSEAELNELLAAFWKLRHESDVYMEVLANQLGLSVSSA